MPVTLLCDAEGPFGLGVVDRHLRKSDCRHLILRPDVLRDGAYFPVKYRYTALHTIHPRHRAPIDDAFE
jgi:hypothetical protein